MSGRGTRWTQCSRVLSGQTSAREESMEKNEDRRERAAPWIAILAIEVIRLLIVVLTIAGDHWPS